MKKVSLVLSGGGARGIVHIGVLEELEKQGYEIHSIVGTSMGAIVGGIYAAGKLKEFKKWILELDKLDVFKLVDFTLFNSGFIKGDKVFKELATFIEDQDIQDLPIHFSANATDLMGKKEVLFTEGSLYQAMRASIAIPNVLTPVKHNDALLVDGGVLNNLPVNHARRLDGDLLIAVNVNADIPFPDGANETDETSKKDKDNDKDNGDHSSYKGLIKKFNQKLDTLFTEDQEEDDLSYFDIMNLSFELMRDEMVNSMLRIYPPDLLIETSKYSCYMYDFYKAEQLIEIGRKAAIKSLNNFEQSR